MGLYDLMLVVTVVFLEIAFFLKYDLNLYVFSFFFQLFTTIRFAVNNVCVTDHKLVEG